MKIEVKVNAEMVGKASFFIESKVSSWRPFLQCVHIIPSQLGGVNIIGCNGYELVIFRDPKGECNKNDGVSIDFEDNKLKMDSRKTMNCKKNIYIKGSVANPSTFLNKKKYHISFLEHQTKNFRTNQIGKVAPAKINDLSKKANFYNLNYLKKIRYLDLKSLKNHPRKKYDMISINKSESGALLITSLHVCYMCMGLIVSDEDLIGTDLYDLWSGYSNNHIDLFALAQTKKNLSELIDPTIASTICNIYGEMQKIPTS